MNGHTLFEIRMQFVSFVHIAIVVSTVLSLVVICIPHINYQSHVINFEDCGMIDRVGGNGESASDKSDRTHLLEPE